MAKNASDELQGFLQAAESYDVSPEFLLDMAIDRYEERLTRLMMQNERGDGELQAPIKEINPEFLNKGDERLETRSGPRITRYHYLILRQYAEYFYFADADKLVKYKKPLGSVESVDQRIEGYIETAISTFVDYLHTRES